MMIKVNDLLIFLLALSGIAYLWFGGVSYISGVHLPPIIAAISICGVITIVLLRRKISIPPTAALLFRISLLLVTWIFIRDLFATREIALAMKVDGGRVLMGVLIAFSIWALASNLRRLRFLTYVLIAAIAGSAIVAIGQYSLGEPFINLLPGGDRKLLTIQSGYISGLAASSFIFGSQLCVCAPLVFGLFISRSVRYRKTFLAIFILLFFSLLLSQSRSAIIGTLLGVSVITWSGKRKGKISFPLLGIAVYLLYGVYVNHRIVTFTDISTQARKPLFLAALLTGFTHPLGTGRIAYKEVASGFYEMVEELAGAEGVLEATAHNQFLNLLGYYGVHGMVLGIVFYIFLFRLFRISKSDSASPRFLEGMRIGLLGGFTAYLIHTFFHNAGPFIGDPVNWYFIGLALATNNLAIRGYSGSKE